MVKIKGFDETGFLSYLSENFNGFENCFLRELVENVLQYAQEREHISKDQFIYFLSNIIPEISFSEIAQFADDNILTEWGQNQKKNYKRGSV